MRFQDEIAIVVERYERASQGGLPDLLYRVDCWY